MQLKRVTTGIAAALVSAFVMPVPGHAQPEIDRITIATANPGTPFAIIGAAMANLYSQNGVPSSTEQGGGVANPILVSTGKVTLGWTHTSNAPNFMAGREPYKEPLDKVRGLGGFNPAATHVLVRTDSGVSAIKDLKGKAYATQPAGNTSTLALELLLEVNGLSFDDLDITRGGQNFGAQQTQDRRVVGFSATTGFPAAAFVEIAQTQDVKFLDISDEELEKLQAINKGFTRYEIPAGTYPGQTDPIRTMGATSIVVVSEDTPEEAVYWMTKLIGDNLEEFKKTHDSMRDLTLEYMAGKTTPVPLHPGAERYYREKGVIQ